MNLLGHVVKKMDVLIIFMYNPICDYMIFGFLLALCHAESLSCKQKCQLYSFLSLSLLCVYKERQNLHNISNLNLIFLEML